MLVVAVVAVGQEPILFGKPKSVQRWGMLVRQSLCMFELCEYAQSSVLLGKHSIVLQREGAESIAALIKRQSPMMKSIRRVIAKKHQNVSIHPETLKFMMSKDV